MTVLDKQKYLSDFSINFTFARLFKVARKLLMSCNRVVTTFKDENQ